MATALLSRDGGVLGSDLPSSVPAEVFSILCATIFGAAVTAHIEFGRPPPDRVVVEGAGTLTVIADAGAGALVVAVVERPTDLSTVLGEITNFSTLLTAREVEPRPAGA